MDFSSLLNEDQLNGVTTKAQYTRIVAGAGSGKTRVLTYRIAHLIENMNIPAFQIMAVTFTNKAANEIKARVNKQIDPSKTEHIFLGTIHSWCARFLRFEAERINYPKNFTILDDEDQLQIMKEIFVNRGQSKSDPKIKQVLAWISKKKTEGIQYKDIKDRQWPNQEIKNFAAIFKDYTEVLEQRKSLDFDDLLLKTIEILDTYPQVKNKYTDFIKYILVDEFQDINDVQFNLISLLMNEETSLYVVGDPDQTIYTWRGANNKIILNLEESLKDINPNAELETIYLNRNYRSTKNILDAANRLIVHNNDRLKKDLIPTNDDGDSVTFLNARTAQEEAVNLVNTIMSLHKEKNVKYNDIAVLYRANYLSRTLETVLLNYRIPYKVFGGMKFFQRKEIKDIVAYFRLVVNDFDDTAFERIINVPKRGIGPGTLEKINEEALKLGQTKYSYISENLNDSPLTPKQKSLITVMVQGIKKIRVEIENRDENVVQHLKDFITLELGYYDYLKEDDESKYDDRKDNVDALFYDLQSQMQEDPNLEFSDFVNNAILQSSQDEVNSGDFVSLMTVHTAKGLEYDYVFVYSFGQGIFPSERSTIESKSGLEEERRLAYVAFTRAKKKLYLTSNQDYSFVLQGPLRPSIFINEAGINSTSNTRDSFSSSFLSGSNPYFKPQGLQKKDTSPKANVFNANESNGIKDWKVGDRAEHTKFGQGTIASVIPSGDKQLVVIQFDNPEFGKKTFMGTHMSIKRS